MLKRFSKHPSGLKTAAFLLFALSPLIVFGWLIIRSAEDTRITERKKSMLYGRSIMEKQFLQASIEISQYKKEEEWHEKLRSDPRVSGYREGLSSNTGAATSRLARVTAPRSERISQLLLTPMENQDEIRTWLKTARVNYAPAYILFALQESKLNAEFPLLEQQLEWEISPTDVDTISWNKNAFPLPEGFEWRAVDNHAGSDSHLPVYIDGALMNVFATEGEPLFIRSYALLGSSLWVLALIIALFIYFIKKQREAKESLHLLTLVGDELRTPLRGMTRSAERLMETTSDQVSLDYLTRINAERIRLQGVLEQFMMQGKLQTSEPSIRFTPWQDWLQAEYERNLRISERKELYRLELMPAHDKGGRIDQNLLGVVLSNLFRNAESYGEGSEIILREIYDENKVGLEVIDHGPGMSPKVERNAFQRYYRGDNALTRNSEGLGLGLSLSQNIVELHDGEITLHNEGGLRVRITLPCGNL